MTDHLQTFELDALEKLDIETEFPADVLDEAESLALAEDPFAAFRTKGPGPFITIDYPNSQDLDQAITIERLESGWRVYYAIADVASYVPRETLVFRHAMKRVTSYYLPGFCIPMLPRVLSEGAASLLPGAPRRAALWCHTIEANGTCSDTHFSLATIENVAKLNYAQVQSWLDKGEMDTALEHHAEIWGILNALVEVGQARLSRPRKHIPTRYLRRGHEVKRADTQLGFRLLKDRELDIETYNAQISIMTNTEAAKWMEEQQKGYPSQHGLDPIYKVHPSPADARVEDFRDWTHELATAHDNTNLIFKPEENASSYLARLGESKLSMPLEHSIHRRAVLVNQRAEFAPSSAPHHGVGVDAYARVTAPLREGVGLFTYHELIDMLGYKARVKGYDDASMRNTLCERANVSLRRQKKLDKAINKAAIQNYFEADLTLPLRERPKHLAFVVGVKGNKLFCMLEENHVEVFVRNDSFEARSRATVFCTQLRQRIRVGDAIALTSIGWGQDNTQLDFEISTF